MIMESATALKNEYIESNPIKNYRFDWIPRHITARKDIPPALKLILSVLHGALGSDCQLMFKERTLANKTGLSVSTVKRALKKGRELRLFATMETGRGIRFKLIYQVAQFELSLIKEQKKRTKEKIITPPPETPPDKPPKKPPAPDPEIGPGGPVANVPEIRKLIPPTISFRLNDKTIKSLRGIDAKHIQYAAKQAMDSKYDNKAGLFIKLCREDLPMCDQINRLTPVPIPNDYPDMSDPEFHQKVEIFNKKTDIIVCYNQNTLDCGCGVMQGISKPGPSCQQFCPYVLNPPEKQSGHANGQATGQSPQNEPLSDSEV